MSQLIFLRNGFGSNLAMNGNELGLKNQAIENQQSKSMMEWTPLLMMLCTVHITYLRNFTFVLRFLLQDCALFCYFFVMMTSKQSLEKGYFLLIDTTYFEVEMHSFELHLDLITVAKIRWHVNQKISNITNVCKTFSKRFSQKCFEKRAMSQLDLFGHVPRSFCFVML